MPHFLVAELSLLASFKQVLRLNNVRTDGNFLRRNFPRIFVRSHRAVPPNRHDSCLAKVNDVRVGSVYDFLLWLVARDTLKICNILLINLTSFAVKDRLHILFKGLLQKWVHVEVEAVCERLLVVLRVDVSRCQRDFVHANLFITDISAIDNNCVPVWIISGEPSGFLHVSGDICGRIEDVDILTELVDKLVPLNDELILQLCQPVWHYVENVSCWREWCLNNHSKWLFKHDCWSLWIILKRGSILYEVLPSRLLVRLLKHFEDSFLC